MSERVTRGTESVRQGAGIMIDEVYRLIPRAKWLAIALMILTPVNVIICRHDVSAVLGWAVAFGASFALFAISLVAGELARRSA